MSTRPDMFARVAWFELRYQLRNPVFWATFTIFFLLTFGSTTALTGTSDNLHKNAPLVIAALCGDLSIFAMFALATFVANAVIRDDETGFGGILGLDGALSHLESGAAEARLPT